MSKEEISLFNKDTSNHELFSIKGKEAFIGYKIPNGNFCFESIPFTEPKNDSIEDIKHFVQDLINVGLIKPTEREWMESICKYWYEYK